MEAIDRFAYSYSTLQDITGTWSDTASRQRGGSKTTYARATYQTDSVAQ